MKNIIFTLLSLCLITFACTDNFEEINENPNAPEEIGPQFLLSNVISVSADKNTYDQGFRLSNYLTQFSASVEFERIDRYEMGTNSEYWNVIFGLLTDIASIKENEATNEAYIAVADIMQSYLFSQLTDMWGDVPYTEALKAKEGLYSPKYDIQESIYTDPETGILAVLKRSAATLSTTNDFIQGDMMFGNDLEKWERFANSLQVRYILRISKRITDFSELQALANSGKLMQSNADNAVVPYLSSAPNQWPMSQSALGLYQEHRMTRTVDSILSAWDDPRVHVLYKPTQKSVTDGNPEFKGLQNGLNRETISERNINLNDISLFGEIFRDIPDGIDAQFMQYAELQFALAEAVERDFITGDAQAYYENGIAASFDYYQTELPADYFGREGVLLDNTDNLTKILTQKWVVLNTNGHEAWFNIRRTGIPAIKPGPDNFNNDQYPVRYLYPESEQATNNANFQEASERMGGNTINSKGWWEKEN
ncbi:SusD/RagB family nutrient-binding outer membrane lipoprotein [Marivirga sp. S37H4]|uniref:SusD/RagB family nutrient-binding outer membrane lipoprotein n=1 Tax=Marivirga aurantiaca TaxID=2802615 RepID=A0A935C977_9BACT|nr:SusD/RagB family nutrient-binding outer membrane lipoprotein [Marivirga aurantiaca]MBK6264103.1 SusD/RagB family nutrient-binding outer membrane lipoprotein [Marivirga aurantiaca]